MDNQNVTIRKHKNKQNESLNWSFMSSTSDYSTKSLPDITTRHVYNEDIENYKQEILWFKQQLQIAHTEIENLLTENNTLKQQTYEQEKKITQLKKMCTGSPYTPKMSVTL